MIPIFSKAMLILTVWLNPVHPVRYYIGVYNPSYCFELAETAIRNRKNPKQHMELSCEPTDRTKA